MSRILRNTSGGKAISGGALAPRSRRNNTSQVDDYFRGGSGSFTADVNFLLVGGGGTGGDAYAYDYSGGGGGGAGGSGTPSDAKIWS